MLENLPVEPKKPLPEHWGNGAPEQRSQVVTTQRDLDVVELWSGAGHIAGAARESGHVAAEFDIERIPGHTNVAGPTSEDITTKGGFRRALRLVLRLRAGGLLWMAPLCCS